MHPMFFIKNEQSLYNNKRIAEGFRRYGMGEKGQRLLFSILIYDRATASQLRVG